MIQFESKNFSKLSKFSSLSQGSQFTERRHFRVSDVTQTLVITYSRVFSQTTIGVGVIVVSGVNDLLVVHGLSVLESYKLQFYAKL